MTLTKEAYDLIRQVLFFGGQTGLLLGAVCSMFIVHITSQSGDRPVYYYVSIWMVGAACGLVFASGFVAQQMVHLPLGAYILRIAIGAERTAVLYFYWLHQGKPMPSPVIRRFNSYVSVVTMAGVLSMVAYGFYTSNQETKQQNQQLVDAVNATRPADSLLVVQLRGQIDSLNRTALANRGQIVSLNKHIAWQTRQINRLVELLSRLNELFASLKQSVRRVDASVERARRSTPTPKPVTPTQPSMTIDPNKVKKPS